MLRIMMYALTIALLTGCAGETQTAPERVFDVGEVPAYGSTEPLLVRGWLIARQGEPVRLCAALAESFPPQCSGPSLVIEGLDLSNVENLESAQGVTWGQVQLRGRVSNGVLEVQAAPR